METLDPNKPTLLLSAKIDPKKPSLILQPKPKVLPSKTQPGSMLAKKQVMAQKMA